MYHFFAHNFIGKRMYAYYNPLFRQGSIKPFVHFGIFTSVVMYSTKYYKTGHTVQERRLLEKQVMKEYYALHGGGGDHH